MACVRDQCGRTKINPSLQRRSDIYGYICDDCFEELVSLGPMADVEKFMATCKKALNLDAARARFDVEFPKEKEEDLSQPPELKVTYTVDEAIKEVINREGWGVSIPIPYRNGRKKLNEV